MCTVPCSTAVLVMLCTKSTQVKMLRRIYHNAGKIHLFCKCNSQLHRQPSIALLLVIKTCSRHVLSERHHVQHQLFILTQKSIVLYKQCKTEVNIVKIILFLKIQYKQLTFQAVFSLQCTKRAVKKKKKELNIKIEFGLFISKQNGYEKKVLHHCVV